MPTARLRRLLASGVQSSSFNPSAMALKRAGANITQVSTAGAHLALARNNDDLTVRNAHGYSALDLSVQLQCHDLISYLEKPKSKLFQSIQAMHTYGVVLRDQRVSKGQMSIDLAAELTIMANKFFAQTFTEYDCNQFQLRFSTLLHSRDVEMGLYRIAWGTIVKNIAISLTGIGFLLIAGKLIYSKATEGRALFFFQKSKTTSEEKIANIDNWIAHIVVAPQLIRVH